MVVRVETNDNTVRILTDDGEVLPATRSTLRLKGFRHKDGILEAKSTQIRDLILFVLGVFERAGVSVNLDKNTQSLVENYSQAVAQANRNSHLGKEIKNNRLNHTEFADFLEFLQTNL